MKYRGLSYDREKEQAVHEGGSRTHRRPCMDKGGYPCGKRRRT